MKRVREQVMPVWASVLMITDPLTRRQYIACPTVLDQLKTVGRSMSNAFAAALQYRQGLVPALRRATLV
jgi:hypothetical protein